MRFEVTCRRRFHPAAVAALVCVALTGCSDSPVDPADDRVPAANLQRILVADATAPMARLVALHNDSLVETFALGGPASVVYRTHSGRFGVVQQRTADRVQFVDGGVWAENDVGHRATASLLGFQLQDGLPTHESVNGDWISVFFDGSGIARWMRETDKIAGTPRIAFEVDTGRPHHGGSFTLAAGGTPFFAHSVTNAAGAVTGVVVKNQQEQVVSQVDDCPSLHGNGSIASGGVFGCSDGLVLVRAAGGSVSAQKVVTSGDMAGLGLRNAYSGNGSTFLLGQFSALPGQSAQRVLATIDPAGGAIQRLPALPTGVVDHWRAVEPVKGQIVLLGTDGNLYVYDGATRQLQWTVAGVVPVLPASGAMTHQVAVAEDLAAVASPTTGQVVLVNLSNGSVIRRVSVGGAPSRLAILGATRAGTYRPAS